MSFAVRTCAPSLDFLDYAPVPSTPVGPPSEASIGQHIHEDLPRLNWIFPCVANGPPPSCAGTVSHHHAGISNRPKGLLMAIPPLLIKI